MLGDHHTRLMTWQEAFDNYGLTIARRSDLIAAGATAHALTSAVRGGHLIRVRRDHYAMPGTGDHIQQAVRVGGRLGCISALRMFEIFAFDNHRPHIHLARETSRPRCPEGRARPLSPLHRQRIDLHWSTLIDPRDGNEFSVGIRDALVQSVRCQRTEHAIASIDNALYTNKISEVGLSEVFSFLPARFAPLQPLVDRRAESGQETVLRLIMMRAGLQVELQVNIDRVGRVDMIVEGILVLEADSRLAHDGWELHVRDRNRDLDLGRIGYMSLRPAYQRTMFHPLDVRDSVLGLLRSWNNYRTTITSAAPAAR